MWTDERLDDLARRIDAGFGRVDADVRELRGEVHTQGAELWVEITALRGNLIRVGGAMIGAVVTGFLGVIAAVLAGG